MCQCNFLCMLMHIALPIYTVCFITHIYSIISNLSCILLLIVIKLYLLLIYIFCTFPVSLFSNVSLLLVLPTIFEKSCAYFAHLVSAETSKDVILIIIFRISSLKSLLLSKSFLFQCAKLLFISLSYFALIQFKTGLIFPCDLSLYLSLLLLFYF